MNEHQEPHHPEDRKFLVTLEGLSPNHSHEVPVYAVSLEEAEELAEANYQEAGFMVTRIRPDVI